MAERALDSFPTRFPRSFHSQSKYIMKRSGYGLVTFELQHFIVVILFLSAVPAVSRGQGAFFEDWVNRVTKTQAEQPHWMPPLVTVTPRLEEVFRYDFSLEKMPNTAEAVNFGYGKGFEIIPAERFEIIFVLPPYLEHNQPSSKDGLGDVSFLVKYRVLAANEKKGNYVLTVFFGSTVPTGTYQNGNRSFVFTPTLAAGKAWGHLSIQSTLGENLPIHYTIVTGRPILSNTAVQYQLIKRLWPEFEVNSTYWPDGKQKGNKQVFLTPGLNLGRFRIHRRLAMAFGGGIQNAATHFHTYNHNIIFTVRLPF